MTHTLYLPIVQTVDPLPQFGAQIEGDPAAVAQWIVPNRVYQIPVLWAEYNQATTDKYVKTIKDAGGRIAFGVKVVPAQYRLWPAYVGSPPTQIGIVALANFVCGLAIRHNPEYIELFNEPNMPRDLAKDYGRLFGAWCIDGENQSIGGRRYGDMLKAVYPALSKYTKVYGGALAYDDEVVEFLAGMGDAPMDCLSWHCYLGIGAPFTYLEDRICRIASVVNRVQVLTETNIKTVEDSPELQSRKASWMDYLIYAVKSNKIGGVRWYTLHGNCWPTKGSDLAPGVAWEKFRG